MVFSLSTYIFLFLISIIVGFINTLAGSATLIMFPVFLSMGLSSSLANGTNRVAVVVQSLVGTITFLRNTRFQIKNLWWSLIPCVAGALFGAFLATIIDADFLDSFIKYLMIGMFVVILINPKRWLIQTITDGSKSKSILAMFVMFVVGFYSGFIQAGAGVFILASLVLVVGYNLKIANAIKLIIVTAYAVPVLGIFAFQGQVDWFWGIYTSLGQAIGAYIGGVFASRYPKADIWVYRLLVVVVFASIIYFFEVWTWF